MTAGCGVLLLCLTLGVAMATSFSNGSMNFDGHLIPGDVLAELDVALDSAHKNQSCCSLLLVTLVFTTSATAALALGDADLGSIAKAALQSAACGVAPKSACTGSANPVAGISSSAAMLWVADFSAVWTWSFLEALGSPPSSPRIGVSDLLQAAASESNFSSPSFRRSFEESYVVSLRAAVAQNALDLRAASRAQRGAESAVFSETVGSAISFSILRVAEEPVSIQTAETERLWGLGFGLGVLFLALVATSVIARRRLREMKKVLSARKQALEVLEARGEKMVRYSQEQMEAAKKVLGASSTSPLQSWMVTWEDVRIISKIGSGSFADVWEAAYLETTPCAVKQLKAEVADEKSFATFHREIELLSQLHHPNVVAMLGCGWEAPHIFLVLELCRRGSLLAVLASSASLSWRQPLIGIARDVARALAYVHAQGIVHRDLKAENVLIGATFTSKLSDFGATMGSPYFTAPEVVRGEQPTSASDVYSFGVLLLEISLRGQLCERAFGGKTGVAVAQAVAGGWRPDLTLVRDTTMSLDLNAVPHLRALVGRAWAQDPIGRPTAEAALKILETPQTEWISVSPVEDVLSTEQSAARCDMLATLETMAAVGIRRCAAKNISTDKAYVKVNPVITRLGGMQVSPPTLPLTKSK